MAPEIRRDSDAQNTPGWFHSPWFLSDQKPIRGSTREPRPRRRQTPKQQQMLQVRYYLTQRTSTTTLVANKSALWPVTIKPVQWRLITNLFQNSLVRSVIISTFQALHWAPWFKPRHQLPGSCSMPTSPWDEDNQEKWVEIWTVK